MSFAMVGAVIAVVAVALYARGQDAPPSVARLVGAAVAIWVGVMVLAILIFFVSTLLFGS